VGDAYADFLAGKAKSLPPAGFAAEVSNALLKPFQRDAVTWALARGRAALFEDTGLGKTRQQLEWARHVVDHARATGLPPRVLVLAPLAVGAQTVREAGACGVPNVRQVREAADVADGISVTNYERLDRFDPAAFAGVVLDESSILKAFSGSTKKALLEAFAQTPYRLACTATPAPNDHLELGNHAEFLGVLSSHQMIARWFINDTSTFGTYRLKGHAVEAFWDWVCSWARCIGKPSDLGKEYSDDGYVLPELRVHYRTVKVDLVADRGEALFRQVEASATGLHAERRRTAAVRAAAVAELVAAEPDESWLLWCDTDYDAAELVARIPGAVEVHGGQTPDQKAEKLLAFADGEIRHLVTKPKLAGMGLNFQRCARVAFVGPSYSYEAFYQAVRRCWRFGQERPVDCYVVLAQTEQGVWQTLLRKGDDHAAMKAAMFEASRRAQARVAAAATYRPRPVPLPSWLVSEGP
jgi:superfamily II DNA or RNA helicase